MDREWSLPEWHLEVHLQRMTQLVVRRWLFTGVAIAGLALTATAVGISRSQGGQEGDPVQFAPTRGQIAPFGANYESEVRDFALRLPRVGGPVLGPAREDPDKLELRFDIAVTEFSGDQFLRGTWEGHLFAGAVRDRLAASQGPKLISFEATLVKATGDRSDMGGGLGHVVSGQIFEPVTPKVLGGIEARAEARGFSDVRTSALPVIQPAIAITMKSAKPVETVSALLDQDGVLRYLLGRPSAAYEGTYVEIRDSDGEPIYIEATAPRAGAGMRWERPGSCLDPRDRYREPSCASP